MPSNREMPKYRCHKEVHALKILSISDENPKTCTVLLVVEKPYSPIEVPSEWVSKYEPTENGYYVVYEDGYTSWSPSEAFEKGYTLIKD